MMSAGAMVRLHNLKNLRGFKMLSDTQQLKAGVQLAAASAIQAGLSEWTLRVVLSMVPEAERCELAQRGFYFACVGEWPTRAQELEGCDLLTVSGVHFRRRANGNWVADKQMSGQRFYSYVGSPLTDEGVAAAIRDIWRKAREAGVLS